MINTFDYTFQNLIADKDYLFEIPNYQRNYVWTEKEILLFLRDAVFCLSKYKSEDEKFEHYTGQMIFRTIKKERDTRVRLEVIDGQQRLTTFMLVVIVAIRIMNKERGNEKIVQELKNAYLISHTQFNSGEDERKLKLSKKDIVFWNELVDGTGPCLKEIQIKSCKRIGEAYEVIERYLMNLLESAEDQREAILAKYIKAMAESFRIVVLITEEPGHEFALFQIVNDRGLSLTSGEMLKARTIELLTSQKRELKRERIITEAESIWADILEDSGYTTERYLIWNYMAMLGKRPADLKKVSLQEYYEKDIFRCFNMREISMDMQDEMLQTLKELCENIHMCRNLETGEFPLKCDDSKLNLLLGILIRNMKNTLSIPLYIKLLNENLEKKALTIALKLTPMLVKTYFLTKIMGDINDESVEKCYFEIWEKLGMKHIDLEEIKKILYKLIDKKGYKEQFLKKIKEDVYIKGRTNLKAKMLLLMSELQYLQESENGTAAYGDDSIEIIFERLSVEHILYEGVREDEVSQDFYHSIHKIGNLTLLGQKLNTREREKDFIEKRQRYCKSPYYITREVGKNENWGYHEFKARQEEMISVLKRAYEL